MRPIFVILLLSIWAAFASDGTGDTSASIPGACCANECVSLIPAYVKVSEALANDDLREAIDAAEDLGLWAECSSEMKLDEAVADFERSRNLTEARIAFREISIEVISLAKWIPGHYVMTCPTAKADWIQDDPEVSNPYYGSKGLRCGTIKEAVGIQRLSQER
jgi:hypothetical protein